ncbi:MarR family winged helix-turn-helix transcriptional regulator [Corynebacterium sp.]|uniref:MarR family winged helix-turn-helix transcriptional regulator n=1 Tax=Corynebacterium sp. TaxID=1720 RepID=UPI0026DB7ABF|nr:MarR family winged helix-turn-helix transcriptional regulator [Corynebacterium sp.]MDO5032169.1 MarR family winged helix-turn-helix transcriptional regulator [Corynebacterium sp.]
MSEKQEPWLDEDELSAFVSLMSVSIRLTNVLDAQLRDDAGLSFFEYTVLSRLSEAENREMRMRDLALTANGSLSRLSQVVSRLEKQGWVSRHPDPHDGRTTIAQLSDAGWQKVLATAPGHAAQARRSVVDNLSHEQICQLHEINRRIIEAIENDERYGGRY